MTIHVTKYKRKKIGDKVLHTCVPRSAKAKKAAKHHLTHLSALGRYYTYSEEDFSAFCKEVWRC